jgi:hypothetical protein
MTENPVFYETSLDGAEKEPVVDATARMHQPPPLPQIDEISIRPGHFSADTEVVPDHMVPRSEVIQGDKRSSDTTGPLDPETVTGITPTPIVGTGDPVVQADLESRSLSADPVREETPIPHITEKTGTDNPRPQVLTDPSNVSTDIPETQGLRTAGGGAAPELIGPPTFEGAPLVSGAVQDTGEPKSLAGGNNHANLLVEGQVPSAGRDADATQKVALILPSLENGKDPQTDSRGRVSWPLSETSEKTSPQASLPPMGKDVSGNSPEGRERGYSAPFHGSKPGMLDPRFELVETRGDTTFSLVKPESTPPGAFQTGDPEQILQIEKMTWSLTGPPGTTVPEKRDILEALRLPLEPREIRTLTDIIEKAVWRQENGQSQARIQLKPAFLGHLHLNVMMDQLKVTVEIRAETLMARDFLETNLHVLKADLQESGLEIDKIDVLVDPDLNNPREQGRTSAQKQIPRLNGHLKEENALTDLDPELAQHVISPGREDNQIDCFV